MKEFTIGILNGIIFAAISAFIVQIWFQDNILSIVISISMILTMIIAGLFEKPSWFSEFSIAFPCGSKTPFFGIIFTSDFIKFLNSYVSKYLERSIPKRVATSL